MPTSLKKTAAKKPAPIAPTDSSVTYLQLYYSLRTESPDRKRAKLSPHGHIDPINGEFPPHHPPPMRKLSRVAPKDPYAAVPTKWTLVDQISDPSLPCGYEIAIRRIPRSK